MRTLQRVELLIGGVSALTLFLGQIGVALAVVWGIVAKGLVAGLALAKWLPPAAPGRRFATGLGAGFRACSMAGAGALASQWIFGPRTFELLIQRAHLAFLDAAPLVLTFGFLGWAGASVLAVLLSVAAGMALAGVTAPVVALGKDRHA
jgi:hypothetical protein